MHDPLAEFYDPQTLRLLDRPAPSPTPRPTAGRARTTLGAGVVLSAMALGLEAVFNPRDVEPVVEEIEPSGPGADEPVRLWFVPGAPRLSRADVRPWLL
ncbi:MAG: hypothetical protein ACRD0G_17515 [Acidimicrobiales bacterium]